MDGTPNKQGTIRYYVNLNIEIHGRKWKEQILVTGLGKHRIILGLPWLMKTNPIIDLEKGTLEWRNPKPINPFEMAGKLAKQAIKYSLDKKHQEIQNRTATTISEEDEECYDFKRLRQLSTVVGSKVQVLMSLEECKS